MTHRKVIAAVAALGLLGGGGSAALAAKSAPNSVTVKAVQQNKVKVNRYFQDGSRFNKDVYTVKSGGTLKFVSTTVNAGPHTFTTVKRSDLPKTLAQMNNCKVCNTLGEAHGADPSTGGPPKFQFLENGTGSDTPPKLDQPGDSAFLSGEKKNESVTLDVTAKKGSTLYFLCLIHPWMQGKVQVR
jgi:plastocyanin